MQNELRQELEIAYFSKIFALQLPGVPPFPPKQCCSLAFHENNIKRRGGGVGGQNVLKQKFCNDLPNLIR